MSAQPLPEPILTGTRDDMKAVPPPMQPGGRQDGQLFVTGDDIFRYDDAPASDPAPGFVDQDTNNIDSIRPDAPAFPAITGRWKSLVQTRGYIDAARVFGLRHEGDPQQTWEGLQSCIDEALKLGRYRVLLPDARLVLSQPIVFHTTLDGDTFGGRLILQGHSPFGNEEFANGTIGFPGGTQLWSEVADTDCFELGTTYQDQGGSERIIGLTLEDLALVGSTTAAVFKLEAAWSSHIFRSLTIIQDGPGDGLDAEDLYLGGFYDLVLRKRNGPAQSGIGLRMRTRRYDANDPVYVSGEFHMHRVAAYSWKQGIVFGENPDPGPGNSFLGGISGDFINAERCDEGVVIGRGAGDIDLSVVWVERCDRCGIRVYNGAQDITLRRIYSLHDQLDKPSGQSYFEGEVVLGKEARGTENPADEDSWNRYSGVTVDGLYQDVFQGPALRAYANPTSLPDESALDSSDETLDPILPVSRVRDVVFRDVRSGRIVSGGVFAESLIVLDDEPYDSLTIEHPRGDQQGGLPGGRPLINHPERVSRTVHSGPLTFQPFEQKRQLPFLDEVYHTPAGSGVLPPWYVVIEEDAPFYHRFDGGIYGHVDLPDAARRRGLELHLMNLSNETLVIQGVASQKINDSNQVTLTQAFAFVRLRPIKLPGGVRRWEVVAQSPSGVTFS